MTLRCQRVAAPILLMAFVLLVGAGGVALAEGGAGSDAAGLRALDQAYVDGWLQEGSERQAAALLPLFTEDAVILPGGGAEPLRGHAELRAFWFPPDSPPTDVLAFEHSVLGVEADADLGVVFGRSRLSFEYDGQRVNQQGNFLITARRGEGGEWKIARMIWNNRTVPDD